MHKGERVWTVGCRQQVLAESAALEGCGSLKDGLVAPGLWEEPSEGAQASPCPVLGRPRGSSPASGLRAPGRSLLQEGDVLVGADRLYVQPVRRRHRALGPSWSGAQLHLIHRHGPVVPGASRGTAPGGGTAGGPGRDSCGRGTSSPQGWGAVVSFLRMQGVPSS